MSSFVDSMYFQCVCHKKSELQGFSLGRIPWGDVPKLLAVVSWVAMDHHKNPQLWTMYRIVALMGSCGQYPSRSKEPPVKKVSDPLCGDHYGFHPGSMDQNF